jgi:hypothetical protein
MFSLYLKIEKWESVLQKEASVFMAAFRSEKIWEGIVVSDVIAERHSSIQRRPCFRDMQIAKTAIFLEVDFLQKKNLHQLMT